MNSPSSFLCVSQCSPGEIISVYIDRSCWGERGLFPRNQGQRLALCQPHPRNPKYCLGTILESSAWNNAITALLCHQLKGSILIRQICSRDKSKKRQNVRRQKGRADRKKGQNANTQLRPAPPPSAFIPEKSAWSNEAVGSTVFGNKNRVGWENRKPKGCLRSN